MSKVSKVFVEAVRVDDAVVVVHRDDGGGATRYVVPKGQTVIFPTELSQSGARHRVWRGRVVVRNDEVLRDRAREALRRGMHYYPRIEVLPALKFPLAFSFIR